MADSNIDQEYQLYQILQRRHLFEKPIEFLVKVRCKDGRLKEIWQPKANIVSSSIGRSLLRIFNKTKVGERGIDMYIGKRRSLSEKMKSNTSIQKETPGNDFSTNCSVASSNSCSWQLLKTNSSTKSISNDNKSTRKVKTRASLSRKQLSGAKSKISLKNSRVSQNARQAASLALLKKSSQSSYNQEQISHSKDLAHSSTKGSKNGSLSKCSQNHSEVTQLEKMQNRDCVSVKVLKSENCLAHVETSLPESSICRSCGTTDRMKLDGPSSSQAPDDLNRPDSTGTTCCSKCFCFHSVADPTSDACHSEPERSALGRRVSIRQTESAFRLKEVTVRKFSGFVHLVLGSETSNKRILKNPFDPKVFQEINSALRNLTNDDCRVVLLSGFGNNFSSGIDLSYLLESEQDRKTAAKNMAEALREFVSLLINFPKPVVAAVAGSASGLGVAILPLCDIVYASDKAFFSCPYTSLAQTPEACSSYTFPNIMGHAMANEMLLRGRKITALEAHQIGLITQVFLPENLMGGAIARVQNLAQQSAKAVECTKALMRNQERRTLESVNQNECRLLIERWSSVECQKAIKLFLDNQTNSI